jgi:hypothetical protein
MKPAKRLPGATELSVELAELEKHVGARISERNRLVWQYKQDGMSFVEIGKMLGVTSACVGTWASRHQAIITKQRNEQIRRATLLNRIDATWPSDPPRGVWL